MVLSTFRSLGFLVLATAAVLPAQDPATVNRAGAGATGLWTLRSRHLVHGMPVQTDNRHNVTFPNETTVRPGISVLVREGFVIGFYDRLKVPAWVAVRWTQEDHESMLEGVAFGRPFSRDEELPVYARADTGFDRATTSMERGHMARHEDNEAWGEDNSRSGCLMSNIVPQHMDMNGEAWNDLENLHQEVVVDADVGITTVWIISGPIFADTDNDGEEDPDALIANNVAVPESTYKVIGWFDDADTFHARGYVVDQEHRIRNNPAHYLRRIRDIEDATGLDFFPDLDDARENTIETTLFTDLSGAAAGGGAGPVPDVEIVAMIPNPAGDENQDETVTLRNNEATEVNVTGWRLRDDAGRSWHLTGTIDPGDERVIRRNGQQMALNNGGDTVVLMTAGGATVDRKTYASSQDGVEITFN